MLERSQNGMIKSTRLNQGTTAMLINYAERLQDEINHVPQEHLPALLNIVHSFRESVNLKSEQDETYHVKVEALRTAITEGEQSGDATPFNLSDIIREAKQESGLNA